MVVLYCLIAVFFSVVYCIFNIADFKDPSFISRWVDYIYISFQVQTTFGVSEIFTKCGKFLIIPQQLISIFYIAIIPAIAVIKISSPPKNAINFSDYLVFYPSERAFRTRYTNNVGITATDVEFDFKFKMLVRDITKNRRNFTVLLQSKKIPNAKPNVSYYLRTKKITDEPKEYFDETQDFDLVLNPAYFNELDKNRVKVYVYIKCNYLIPYKDEKVYDYDKIICGKLTPLLVDENDKLSFDNFNKVEMVGDTESGEEKCLNCCFYEKCTLSNKVNI